MPNLNVSYQDMLNEAQMLRQGQQDITQQLTMLRNRINNLVTSGFVTDAASGVFNASYEQFNQGATQTISALDSLAANLQTIADTLQSTDQQLAQQMRGQ